MYLKRNIFSILLIIAVSISNLSETHAHCSLEKMKRFAMEACTHLFQQDEGREKRSLSYQHNLVDDIGYYKFHDKKLLVSRSIFPAGGYLKVGHEHFNKLSQLDIPSKYKPIKLHHLKKERFKRAHAIKYNNIPYCCLNRCEEDFFC